MEPLAQTMRATHTPSEKENRAACSVTTNPSGIGELQYPWYFSILLFLFSLGPVTFIAMKIFNSRCEIQQKRQQEPMCFEDLMLNSNHLGVLGLSFKAWKTLKKQVMARETPLATRCK